MTGLRIGVDVGTSAVKAALFGPGGEVRSRSVRTLPPIQTRGAAAWQPLEPVARAAEGVLADLELAGGGPAGGGTELVALTAQRDTAVLLDRAGRPCSELISWRDGRAAGAGSLWDALAGEDADLPARLGAVRALPSFLSERWTGRALETPASLSMHLRAPARRRLAGVVGGPDAVDVPDVRPLGEAAARIRSDREGLPGELGGVLLHVTAGDKNCEMLANGVRRPGRGFLSLGSAVSLGTLAAAGGAAGSDGPAYRSPAALRRRRNVEVGLVGGLDGSGALPGSREAELRPDGRLRPDVWCVPYFRGALDAPGARALVAGLGEETDRGAMEQAWAQGVVAELRRLRPGLESAAGAALEGVVVGGGGGTAPGWARLVADALDLPARRTPDPWAGARGAVAAVLLEEAPGRAEALLGEHRWGRGGWLEPDPPAVDRWDRYFPTYAVLSRCARGLDRLDPGGSPGAGDGRDTEGRG